MNYFATKEQIKNSIDKYKDKLNHHQIIDIQNSGKEDAEFDNVKYRLHVLPLIYPDPNLNERDNSVLMMQKDYEQKKEAYEKAYGKKLDYKFEFGDIAGLKKSVYDNVVK